MFLKFCNILTLFLSWATITKSWTRRYNYENKKHWLEPLMILYLPHSSLKQELNLWWLNHNVTDMTSIGHYVKSFGTFSCLVISHHFIHRSISVCWTWHPGAQIRCRICIFIWNCRPYPSILVCVDINVNPQACSGVYNCAQFWSIRRGAIFSKWVWATSLSC